MTRTSVLDRLSGQLWDAMLEESGSAAELESCRRATCSGPPHFQGSGTGTTRCQGPAQEATGTGRPELGRGLLPGQRGARARTIETARHTTGAEASTVAGSQSPWPAESDGRSATVMSGSSDRRERSGRASSRHAALAAPVRANGRRLPPTAGATRPNGWSGSTRPTTCRASRVADHREGVIAQRSGRIRSDLTTPPGTFRSGPRGHGIPHALLTPGVASLLPGSGPAETRSGATELTRGPRTPSSGHPATAPICNDSGEWSDAGARQPRVRPQSGHPMNSPRAGFALRRE